MLPAATLSPALGMLEAPPGPTPADVSRPGLLRTPATIFATPTLPINPAKPGLDTEPPCKQPELVTHSIPFHKGRADGHSHLATQL